MKSEVTIRPAHSDDAAAMAKVLRRSIKQLCAADHNNNAEPLGEWLANKKARIVRRWLRNPEASMLLAEVEGRIAAVGAFTSDGEVMLNYVDPEFRYLGISKALMLSIEHRAIELGLTRLHLNSTLTAERFYQSIGFSANGPRQLKHGLPNQPMEKRV